MKRICNIVSLAVLVAVMLIANFAPVSAKKGKTGPGYTSPPLCMKSTDRGAQTRPPQGVVRVTLPRPTR